MNRSCCIVSHNIISMTLIFIKIFIQKLVSSNTKPYSTGTKPRCRIKCARLNQRRKRDNKKKSIAEISLNS
jgi:hypothetical protein